VKRYFLMARQSFKTIRRSEEEEEGEEEDEGE